MTACQVYKGITWKLILKYLQTHEILSAFNLGYNKRNKTTSVNLTVAPSRVLMHHVQDGGLVFVTFNYMLN